MSITREQVLALQALEREATEGEIDYETHPATGNPIFYSVSLGQPIKKAADALLMIRSRNALPALITTWLSMADRIAAVEKVLAELNTCEPSIDSFWKERLSMALVLNAQPEEQG